MKAKIIQHVEGVLVVSVVDVDHLIAAMEIRNAECIGTTSGPHYRRLRPMLQDQPRFNRFAGPMYDEINGEPALRYEDVEANRQLSA